MKHPIVKVAISTVLVAIMLFSFYFLFNVVSSDNEHIQYINWHKAILYGFTIAGSCVGLLLLNTKLK